MAEGRPFRILRLVGRKHWSPYTYIELYWTTRGYYLFWRDKKTGRFVPSRDVFYRYACVLQPVIHSKYFGVHVFAYVSDWMHREHDDDVMDFVHGKVKEVTEAFVGYPESEWWFEGEPDCEVRDLPIRAYDPKEVFDALNMYNVRIEHEGVPIRDDWYELPPEINPDYMQEGGVHG